MMKLTLANIFSSHMVLQHGKEIRIYGTAVPGIRVSGSLGGNSAETAADSTGRWILAFPKMSPGGPYTIRITSGEDSLELEDVLLGDVWLCSGQSNMVIPMDRVRYTYPDEMASPYGGEVRMFSLPENPVFGAPADDLPPLEWKCADPGTIGSFSAVGWFFGTTLHRNIDIPIGIIVSAVGGTPIESWLPLEELADTPSIVEEYEQLCSPEYRNSIENEDQKKLDIWNAELNSIDPGLTADPPWYDSETNISDWDDAVLPHPWKPEDDNRAPESGRAYGSYWYSLDITLPPEIAGKSGLLRLGRIIDSDTAWLNGTEVGATGYQYPPRIYNIPEGVLKKGENRISLRIVSGAIPHSVIPDKPYSIEVENTRVSLEGTWKYRRGARVGRIEGSTRFVSKPVCLFNGMIAPLSGIEIKGVVWYQGESNTQSVDSYGHRLEQLTETFRSQWKDPALPLIMVQLPVYGSPAETTGKSSWAELREIQRRALQMKNTAMAVTLDCGEWNDIHPLKKGPVGCRAGIAALQIVYGENTSPGSPVPAEVYREGANVRISFENFGTGIVMECKDQQVHCFIEMEEDRWERRLPRADRDSIVIDSVPSGSFRIRYAWADNPAGACIFNREGFPASPFELTVPAG